MEQDGELFLRRQRAFSERKACLRCKIRVCGGRGEGTEVEGPRV
jgi:hypothetical protein